MNQSNPGFQNNLPPSLQQQLSVAAQQVDGDSGGGRSGNHPHARRDRRPYRTAPDRTTFPRDGFAGNAGLTTREDYTCFPHVRGRGPLQPQLWRAPFSNHPRQSGSSVLGRRGAPAKDPCPMIHQPSSCGTVGHERTVVAGSDASSVAQVPAKSAQQLPSLAAVGGEGAPGSLPTLDQACDHHKAEHLQTSTSTSHHSSSHLQTPAPTHLKRSDIETSSSSGSSHLAHRNLSQARPTRRHQESSQTSDSMSFEAFKGRVSHGQHPTVGRVSRHVQPQLPQNDFYGFMTDLNAPARSFRLPSFSSRPFTRRYHTGRRLGDPNTYLPNDVERQYAYLNFLTQRQASNQITERELLEKESFRKKLEKSVQQLVEECAKGYDISFSPHKVKLKCYGSLASGFAVPGSDMDLLLAFPKDEGPVGRIEVDARRMVEKEFLDRGYGARLLVNTRVPILRVCQAPSPELLANLRRERKKWEEDLEGEEKETYLRGAGLDPQRLPSIPTDQQSEAAMATFAELDIQPSTLPLPPSPARANADLEYKDDVGIQCDINFSNHVAIHNTILLRCYCKCDPRVRPMGLFVKEWSKARKINTPYYGTLSSYGYIMMVLHYLMNIAQPPVIPNLQHLAKDEDAWDNKTDIELFEGFDIRFIRDEALLEHRARAGQVNQNRESLASLLHGFFRYYSDSRGFHWLNEAISIRTQGGVLTKASKDWLGTKRVGTENNVVLRYILAIEDPFEIDHNIARTVCHSGICAIRGEFRRAWNILSRIQYARGRWYWHGDDGLQGEDLLASASDRGDLLKKDQEYGRERYNNSKAVEAAHPASLKLAGNSTGNKVQKSHGPSRAKLIKPGRGAQNVSNRKEVTTAENVTHGRGNKVNDMVQEAAAKVSQTSSAKGYDISKWVKSTADAARSAESDAGKTEKYNSMPKPSATAAPTTGNNKVDSNVSPTNKVALVCPSNAQNAGESLLPEALSSPVIDPSNPLSAWNLSTQHGRWFDWRDKKIMAGEWNGEMIPPEMQDLHRLYPFEAARPLATDEKTQRAVADLRAKRLQYFTAQQTENEKACIKQDHGDAAVGGERKDSAIGMANPPVSATAESELQLEHKAVPFQLAEPRTNGKIPLVEKAASDYTLALSSNDPEVVHGSEVVVEPEVVIEPGETAEPAAEAEPEATAEHMALKKALPPRFIDPDIYDYRYDFPIPSAPDFEFDPVQLRDLETIAKGGDGCARGTWK